MDAPQVGAVVDGYTFLGGDPSQQGSWKQAGPSAGDVQDGYVFKGGDPSSPSSWEKQGLIGQGISAIKSYVKGSDSAPANDAISDEISAFSSPSTKAGSVMDNYRAPYVGPDTGSQIKTYSTLGDVLPCLLYTSPSPRDRQKSRMPSSA